MASDFKKLVDEVFHDFFVRNNIKYDKTIVSDRVAKELVYYFSDNRKICFYKSLRDAEINCLLSVTLNADYEVSSTEWSFIREFTTNCELTIEELLKNVPEHFQSEKEQLINIKNIFEEVFKLKI